jgi:hypothetical protein
MQGSWLDPQHCQKEKKRERKFLKAGVHLMDELEFNLIFGR